MSDVNPYASPKFDAGYPLVSEGRHPPSVLGAIGRGTTLYVQCFPAVALIVLSVWAPLEAFISYQEYFVLGPDDGLAVIRLSMLADAFVGIIASGGVISVGAAALRGQRKSWLHGLGDGLAAWPRMFAARFLAGLFIVLALLLFVLPGLYLAVRFSLAESIAIIERKGGMNALSRSQQLTRGQFWQFLALQAIAVGSLLALGAALQLPLVFFPEIDHWLLSAALTLLVDLAMPWLLLIYVAAYFATTDHERRQREIESAATAVSET